MKKHLFVIYLSASMSLCAQVGIGTVSPDNSAALELNSIEKGFLPPRLSEAERDAIVDPAEGLIVYNFTSKCLEVYTGVANGNNASDWKNFCVALAPPTPPVGPIGQLSCEGELGSYTFTNHAEWTDGARVVQMISVSQSTVWPSGESDIKGTQSVLSSAPDANWTPQGVLYSLADQDFPCFSTKFNVNSAITWNNDGVNNNGSGGFVIDLQSTKTVDFISAFNTPSDGSFTHLEIKSHSSTSGTPPDYSDAGWSNVITKTAVEGYLLDSVWYATVGTTTDSLRRYTSAFTYSLQTPVNARYWRVEVWNDAALLPNHPKSYIEMRQLKLMKRD
ncbi:MAG: hypothetical protein N4A45_06115 [Flavobacteriales bacterium]|jgi:hypothetical protein|nr:hypothetical protein [Flavobacteriales bacterium]